MLFALRLLAAASVLIYTDSQAALVFPVDAGAINVRNFGAKGDGVTDDTAAIKAALTASGSDTGPSFWKDKIVYFPSGTYLVSSSIEKRYPNGKFGSGAILMGEDKSSTIIRLKDNAEGYNNQENPKAIFFTTAKLIDGTPTSGGKDYTGKGEGNDAYMNYVENMTIDAGKNNPGAIGIDYLANNMGAVRNVLVRAAPGSGSTGIALTRKWPGPSLLQNVTVDGFTIGIDAANTEYGVTMEAIALKNQEIGLRNNHNVLSIHDLAISQARQPIVNLSQDGLMVIEGGKIENSTSGSNAIDNKGYMNIRSLHIQGYETALGMTPPAVMDGVYNGNTRLSTSGTPWSLPVEYPPAPSYEPPQKWVSVTHFGAKPDSEEDSTGAIRKAFASGAATVYFPHGTYLISDNIIVPPSVRHIIGMTSTIHAVARRPSGFRRDFGMFRTNNMKNILIIEKLAFDNSWLGDQVAVEAAGSAPLYLRDVVGAGVTTLLRPAGGGKAFMDNTCCGTVSVAGSQGVWARQLNTEGPGVRIANIGAPLWILGIKTEQDCTVLDNKAGAHSEILGGLLYITGAAADPSIPAFRNTDSHILLSYGEESFNTHATYAIHLLDTEKGVVKTINSNYLPKRNTGRMAPEISE